MSKTARILGISRKTVRKAREGPLEDLSRRPKSSPNRLKTEFEQLILTEAKRTGYGPMRLSKLLWRKYTLGISPNTSSKKLYPQGVAPYFTPSLTVPHLSESGQAVPLKASLQVFRMKLCRFDID